MNWEERMMQEAVESSATGDAVMTPGTKVFDGDHYHVAIRCSQCGTRQILAFAGWSGILCRPSIGGCGAELKRTPYFRRM